MATIIFTAGLILLFLSGVGVGLMLADFYKTMTEVNDK